MTTPPEPARLPTEPNAHRLLAPLLASAVLVAFVAPPETRATASVAIAALGVATAVIAAHAAVRGRVAWGALLAVAFLAYPVAVTSASPGAALAALAPLGLAVALGVGAASIADRARYAAFVAGAIATGGAIAGAHGVWQRLFGLDRAAAAVRASEDVVDRAAYLARLEGERAFAAFPTPAILGGCLAMAMAVTAAIVATSRGGRRAVAIVALVVQSVGLAATASVTAIAALAIAALATLLFRRGVRRAGLALAAVAAVTVAAIGGAVFFRGAELTDLEHENHPLVLRAGNVRIAAEIVADHPVLGVGPGGFAEHYNRYRRPGENESRFAHDLPLQMIAELGVPLGLVAVGGFAIVFLGPLWRVRRRPFGLDVGLAAALAAFAIHNLVDFTFYVPSALSIAAVVRGLASAGSTSGVGGRTAAVPVRALGVAAVAVASAVVAGEGLSREARLAARIDAAPVVAAAREAVAAAPWNPDARIALAAESRDRARTSAPDEAMDAWEAALDAAEAAVAAAPRRASPRALRAEARLALGDVPGAWVDIRQALRFHPHAPGLEATERRIAARLPEGPS